MSKLTPAGPSRFLLCGPADAKYSILLAHGAGAPMTSPFLAELATRLAGHGLRVARFEFDYMVSRRTTGKRRPPPGAERLLGEYTDAVADMCGTLGREKKLVIGGKSLGGRVASMIAENEYNAGRVAGLICFGYPFHPPNKPLALRTAHLENLSCPALIVQGERDPFGTRAEVASYRLSKSIRVSWIENAGHDLTAPKGQASAAAQGIETAAATASEFIKRLA